MSNEPESTQHKSALQGLKGYLSSQILGQEKLVDRLLIALLADGHLLVEGAPGLAKTKAIKDLAEGLEAEFHRIQFTPDLLPADITGTEIYRPETGTFVFQQGPIFHHLVLADEINRAPAKVQSALLEAMAERQVSVGRSTYDLPQLFLVMATQNPIEQEGTYPLPEAQLDRFLMHVKIGYPEASVERRILQQARGEALNGEARPERRVTQETIFAARQEILGLYMADAVEEYLVQLIMATRTPAKHDAELAEWISYGASPRGSIALDRCARAHAWLGGRDFVSPEDIQAVLFDVLRHRLILTFEAEAAGIDQDRVVRQRLFFGSGLCFKAVLAARAAAFIGWSALAHNDRIGGLVFSDRDCHEIKPRRSKHSLLQLFNQLLRANRELRETPAERPGELFGLALRRAREVLRPGSLILVLCDERTLNDVAEQQLSLIARHTDLVLLPLSDPLDHALPAAGLLRFREGAADLELDTHADELRQAYRELAEARRARWQRLAQRLGVPLLPLSTQEDLVEQLRDLLEQHQPGYRA